MSRSIHLRPVVQSIVSIMTSFKTSTHYVYADYISKLYHYFLLEKCKNLLQCKEDSHTFPTKNNTVFAIFMFVILTKR